MIRGPSSCPKGMRDKSGGAPRAPHAVWTRREARATLRHQELQRMVRLRFKRMGRKNLPFFRLCAFDSRTRRDGRAIEELGHYDPRAAVDEKKFSLNRDRISYWLS